MMHDDALMSAVAFKWFVTLLTGIVGGLWLVYDVFNLYRIRTADRRDALVQDKRFGYMIGIAVGAVAVIGCLKYHDVL